MKYFSKSHITFIVLCAFLFIPFVTNAQTATADQQATIASVKNTIGIPSTKTSLVPADVSELSKCTGSKVATGTCGEVAEQASNYDFVTYNKGDIVKCGGLVNVYCAVTNGSGTTYEYSGPTGKSSVQTDSQGKIIGGGNQSLADSATGLAAHAAVSAAGTLASDALQGVAMLILTFANLILALAGTLLNWVIVKTVFGFSTLIGNAPGLLVAWGILRDLGNMVLLFGFIFMGLGTILNLQTYNAKKAIPPLIIYAVLLNFSLFAAEAVIDISNGLTSTMYNQANTDNCGGVFTSGGTSAVSASGDTSADCATNYGIAGHIMQSTGLSSSFSVTNGSGGVVAPAALIGLALFATIGAVVLLAAAIMLAIRAVILTFLMVFAPLGFAGMAIPAFQGMARKWWHNLIHQAFFAPILFLLLFVSLKVTDSFAGADTRGSLANALTQPSASVVGIILIFTLVIGFLIGSLIAARSFGAMGASFAVNFASNIVYGGVARGTNFVVGGGATTLRRLQQTSFGQKIPGGKFVNKRILTPLASQNLDLRRAPIVKSALTRAGATEAAKPSEHATFADMQHQFQDAKKNIAGAKREKEYQSRIGNQSLEEDAHHVEESKDPDAELSTTSKQKLQSLGEKQLMELHGIKEGLSSMARNLTPEQFNKLMANNDLDGGIKGKLRTGRFTKGVAAVLDDPESDKAKGFVASLSDKSIEHLMQSSHRDKLIDNPKFANLLREDQFNKVMGNDNLSDTNKGSFFGLRNGPDGVKSRLKTTIKAEDVENLPEDTLANVSVLDAMNGMQLAGIYPEKITDSEKQKIITDYVKGLTDNRKAQFDRTRMTNPKFNGRWAPFV